MTNAQLYKNAVNVLKPNAARMKAINAAHNAMIEKANAIVTDMMKDGKTGTELYQEACTKRNENETELNKTVRIVLLGLARKGK